MNRKLKILYIIIIIAFLCIPVGFMRFYSEENKENRTLSAMPNLIVNNRMNEDFGSEFENYISDHFAFRSYIVNANSTIKAKIFGLSGNESITVGKEGWLFFSETIDDYTSKNVITDREAYCTAKTLELMNLYAEDNGCKFMFTIAPNKAALYSQYLPYYYNKSNIENNMDKVTSRLGNVDYIDLKQLFESNNQILYHKLDSHWNNNGALLVVNTILNHLNLKTTEYSPPVLKKDWEGDLSEMLYPSMEYKDEQYYYDDSEFTYSYTRRFKSVDDMNISTENKNSDNGNLLLFRDSFGRSMLPFIGNSFTKAELSRSVPYNFKQIENNNFDYVILEIVERNIYNIIKRAPYLSSKTSSADISLLNELSNSDYEINYEEGELNHIYGKISVDIKEDTDIYISVGNDIYEAFPCYECDEDEEIDGKGNGFALYTDNPSKDIKIYITK